MSAVAALLVSTHSRPKAAGSNLPIFCPLDDVSTHSRPKAAGRKIISLCVIIAVSTHSRPKAAVQRFCLSVKDVLFQLTAARRRLVLRFLNMIKLRTVSTHSRPKAAGRCGRF